jgi:hypothetical protein
MCRSEFEMKILCYVREQRFSGEKINIIINYQLISLLIYRISTH